jgi:hypothetical protein
LVRACEPRPVGKAAGERHQIAVLEKEVVRLRQDCTRHQALVRASQRTIGLAASPQPAAKPAGKNGGKTASKAKRKRRPVARALKAVATLRAASAGEEPPAVSSLTPAVEVVERCVVTNPLPPAVAVPAAAAAPEG